MIYGHNPLWKKTSAEFFLLQVKCRKPESPKEALKYKSVLNFSLFSDTPTPTLLF